ncbi:MAG: CBS domain-containing protein [Myxococcales bacterium]|nr:CBS domain-containing protein [Myxococcales bacterium]MCB9552077.1 CBS domain-containing protein [Myxococcales bacterium]
MRVSQYMSAKVITARPEDGIRETFFRMRQHRVRHLPVVDGAGRLVGFISDRDLRRPDWVDEAVDISHAYQLEDDLQVADLMTRNVEVAHTYDPIARVVGIMLDRRYGALPVLDKEGDLVGIISAIDLLRALAELLDAQKG